MLHNVPTLTLATAIAVIIVPVLADPNDWVNIKYVLQQSNPSYSSSKSSTKDAQSSIIRGANSYTMEGPWSVTNSKGVLAPSGDPHDYLSWAPYHWPNCNWCGSGSGHTHLAHGGDSGNDANSGSDVSDHSDHSNTYPEGKSDWNRGGDATAIGNNAVPDPPRAIQLPAFHRRMNRIRRKPLDVTNSSTTTPTRIFPAGTPSEFAAGPDGLHPALLQLDIGDLPMPTPLPTSVLTPSVTPGVTSQTTKRTVTGTPASAQAPAKTRESRSPCTPSPTTSMPPSATWTTCPYVTHDGQVNPDVRTLNGPGAINSASQAILYNSITYALQNSSSSSRNVAHFIDTFFLNNSTRMNPNMNFGQVVRGPGPSGQSGTFTGVLDLRGLVKVVNGILVMKAAGSPDWTDERDQGMTSWVSQYVTWLTDSDIGKMTASRPNNHGTFYVSQVAAAKIHAGDNDGAAIVLQNFFNRQFLDQVARSGEQPFEAVRTRPFHYRCFNLEALITNAKLGDQIGLDFWTVKSKYGATIQTALDYVMTTNPKNEDINEIVPHVASISAAYGDPTGKYAEFMKKTMANYQGKSFWFYDQTSALPNSPATTMNKRSTSWAREDFELSGAQADVSFQCPLVFQDVLKVEVDNGIFVTCDELKPFYGITQDT